MMTLSRIDAPFTDSQVEALNRFQARPNVHPFTCPGDRSDCAARRELIATPEGWVCQCGRYTQDWAHGVMVELGRVA